MRKTVLVVLCGLALVAGLGLWLHWPQSRPLVRSTAPVVATGNRSAAAASTAVSAAPKKISSLNFTNPLAFRLTNTALPLRELALKPHAILLQNLMVDTDARMNLAIPAHLKSTGNSGAYLVQARGQLNAAFRSLIASAGAQVVSYIPNNAYLVHATATEAGLLSASPLVQAVLPYEPYYKLQPSLLGLAVEQSPLPPGTALNLGLFASDATAEAQVQKTGATIIGRDRSAFGPVLRVTPPANWTALAQLPGVQAVEPAFRHRLANDLSRVALGVTTDTVSGVTNDWLGLTGANVLVAVNDSGVDATHPDFSVTGSAASPGTVPPSRITGFNLVDTDGHGTHVAGIIAGNGSKSLSPVNVGSVAEGSITNADFRGKAPAANLFSLNFGNPDYVLQTNAAVIGALISNNSWDNGDAAYDLAASSYDAATRDAIPERPGSQPVLFVFAAGNNGGGNDYGALGNYDTVASPGTAKNVITVGAIEQLRNITNIVTVLNDDGTTNYQGPYWQAGTDSSSQVAAYSSRGNVGVGTEGSYGRFKPDVVTPGTFVVSTRSRQWDTNAYYSNIGAQSETFQYQLVITNALNAYPVAVPPNAVGVNISVTANQYSPNPFPPMPLYVNLTTTPTTSDLVGSTTFVVPPGFNTITLANIVAGGGFYFAVGNPTNQTVNYDVTVTVSVTNNIGDRLQVLERMNDSLGGFYRYETGTSMSAAAVSGLLALMQDYFTNTLHTLPSPALLKAMLINGARQVGGNKPATTNQINYDGWGLPNLANSLPVQSNSVSIGTGSQLFFADQNVTNALATGDAHTYLVTINTNSLAPQLNLRATLVWTDPPGDPNAAIKLVNNLDLVVTNLDTGAIYYGNDFSGSTGFSQRWNTNAAPTLDIINNVRQVILPPLLAGHYSVTVLGRLVNVNAVTAQTNNLTGAFAPNTVQDFALVVSCTGGLSATNAFTATDGGLSSNPTGDQNITFVASTNAPLFNQFAGENTPLLGTNNLPIGTNTVWGSSGVVTIGMTNQWHFYVVTNNALDPAGNTVDVTNAAFIVFNSATLAVPRMGTLASSAANATRPEADIDLYVSTDASLTNLNPVVISNCLAGTVAAAPSPAPSFGASLGQGGTEFVTFANSQPGQVYYIGVKSEDHMAAEYAFLPVFTSVPFSLLDEKGNQIVNGMLLPVNIPDGGNTLPGVTNVYALAIYPMTIAKVIVTNLDEHENAGDLFGALSFNGTYDILNNHNLSGNTFGALPQVYDDSRNPIAGSVPSAGPGSLVDFRGKSAPGLFILSAEDDANTQTGRVSVLTMKIQPHRDLRNPSRVFVPAHGWFIDYVDVPPGYTNLTFAATNLPVTVNPPIQMYEKLDNEPTLTDYDQRADLTNCITGTYPTGTDPGNAISVGPPLNMGRYFIGLYNPSDTDATVLLSATLGFGSGANNAYSFASDAPAALLDDAVSSSTITVPNSVTQLVASVNVGIVVNSPRISDYTFTLVSPTGQRVLLMENRGGADTNGAGLEFVYTNVINSTATGDGRPDTNYLAIPGNVVGLTVPITYDFYTVPDEMTVYAGTNPATFTGPYQSLPNLPFDTGFTNNPLGPTTINVTVPPGVDYITIIMNQNGNPFSSRGDAWTYTAGAPITNYEYMVFTDDTNLANNVPIKFAQPPFSLSELASNFTLCDFELATNGLYHGPTNIPDAFGGWTVPTNLVSVSSVFNLTNQQFMLVTNVTVLTNNQVSVVADPSDSIGDNVGTNLLALAYGTITRNIATVPGRIYNVTFWFRGPGINGWWRGEGDALDSSDPEKNANNGALIGRFNFPSGVVGQSFGFEDLGQQFQFAGTNTYVQIPQSTSLDVGKGGGFTVEGWISPTNLFRPQPLVEWLAKVPTNSADTNFNRVAGPYFNPATGHYYYLLGATNWTVSETWATALGGHLATVNSANEQNWIFDNFANYAGTNRNLWIGLTNTAALAFGWVSGQTNSYTNWLSGQPINGDGTRKYTFIRGATNLPSGLWACADNNGSVLGAATTVTNFYGVVEVDQIQTNGVQFWVSVTNSMPGGTNTLVNTNGCLYANLIDTSNVWHEIYSAPGLLQSNVFQHVALTFDTNSGLAKLYFNGTNVATTNLFQPGGPATPIVPFVPRTDGDLLLGRDLTPYTNNYFSGRMDEMSIYSRALSDAEIAGIYNVSATATNGLTGKFDPTVVPEPGLAEAAVVFGSTSNFIFGVNNQWEVNSYTFTATSNTMPLRITGLQPGILLDDFSVSEAPLANIYYLPEQSLNDTLAGDNASGTWTMQVWDTRTGAYVTNLTQLVSWDLNFILQSNAQVAATLSPQTPTPITVGPGQLVSVAVSVPSWANDATNILVSSTLPVNLFFNQTSPPSATVPPDYQMLNNVSSGIGLPVLSSTNPPSVPPLLPGQTYYLGVQNNGATAASVVLEVDYDITGLTNGVPYSSTLTTNDALRYFSFAVTSNAYAATFQLLQMNGNADLVLRKGVPLPNLTNTDYGSFNASSADENIYLFTNANLSPIPLSAGTWYLGVIRRDATAVNYTVLAKELDAPAPSIIDLTNAVPFNFNAGPGAALTNFFRFSVTNNPALTNAHSVRFQLYNLSGNGDLTVQTNALPLAPPFFESSQNSFRNPEMIWVPTNTVLTNLALNWYLGVPNREITNISYTIVATIDTNAYFPAFPGAEGTGGGAMGAGGAVTFFGHGTNSTVYHVTSLDDSGPGTLRDAVSSTNRTVVFDVSGTIYLQSRLVITNSYLTLAGQTAPGDGVTVAGWETSVTNAHDIIIRYLRFRPGDTNGFDALRFITVSNVIADHVTATWAPRQVVSVLDSTNFTMQWSVISQQLYATNAPGDGSQLRAGNGALSFHHNLYADNNAGSPHLADNINLDFVNNVIYNWGTNSGFAADDSTNNLAGYTNQMNFTGNYLIAGTNSFQPWVAFRSATSNTWIFQTNNFIDSTNDGVLNGGNTQWNMFTNVFTNQIVKLGQPLPLVRVSTDEAYQAYERVLAFAGTSLMQRDPADTNLVTGVRRQNGQIITSQNQVGGWPALNSNSPWVDTDQDGIPDYWEITFFGTYPNPTNSIGWLAATNVNSLGYTRLEEYLNWLGAPHALTVTNAAVAVDLYKLTGNSGSLAFSLTNAVNGTVYLTNVWNGVTNTGPFSNSIAVFTPTNTTPAFTGYASFDYYVTNNDTVAYFGPVTVSVVVSGVPISPIITLTNLMPFTNFTSYSGLDFYRYNVSTNCYGVKFEILNPTGDVNLYASPGLPLPLVGNPVFDASTNGGTTNELILVLTNTVPQAFTNGWWYLTVSNASGAVQQYTMLVTELVAPEIVAPTSLPLAFTHPAQSANGQSAQLAGMATPSGLPAMAWFQWGTSTNYGLITPPTPVGATNFNVAYVTSLVTGLTVNVPYHFRLVVSNLVGTAYGFDQIFDQGYLVAWGADFLGQTVPLPPGATNNLITAIGAGYDFSIALNNNGSVVSWGDGIFGQTNVPAYLTNAVSVSGGYKDGLALRRDRSVLVWGSNQFKQTNVPPNLTNAVLAVSGDWHCLALRDDGTVMPWGNNSQGQTNLPSGLSNIVSIASGGFHSLAVKNDGTVAAWGDNTYGQTNVPAGLSNVVAVAGGESHSVALKYDGTIISWGDDSLGQVSQTPAGSNFIAIACGGFHSLALRNDGTVAQWGDSSAGQNPVFAATNLANVFAIAGSGGGGFHSLALSSLYGLNQTNNAPFWTNNSPTVTIFLVTNQPANVLFTNAATDTNVPTQILSYKLLNAPSWAIIGQYTGIITFTNVEPQGVGVTTILTNVVTDNGYPALSATNTVTVLVYEINTPPFWPPGVPSQTNYVINAANTLTVADPARDADLPTNVLTYSVSVSGGVTNVFISTNGIFTWTPSPAQVSSTNYTVTVTVTDTNAYALTNQTLTATNTFTVTVLPPLTLTNGLPSPTNVLAGNSVEFFLVPVPTNADFATNRLLFATPAGVNVWFTTNAPPSVGATNDALLITNSTGGSAVIGTNGVLLQFPNSLYWLGVQNTNSFTVTNALEVDFHLLSSGAPVNFASIIYTNNIAGSNGFLLTWFAPSNDLFKVDWSPVLPPSWTTFSNPPVISFNTNFAASATNATFTFFDDGSQTGGFGTNRFYRLLLLAAPANTLTFPAPSNQVVSLTSSVTVTNKATDSNLGAVLTYSLIASPAGAAINSASGVITWPSATPSGLAARFTTLVTDNGTPSASATNTFTVFVLPPPSITNVTVTATNATLSWLAPTNDQFRVQWTTNLAAPINWTQFPQIITSPVTGVFSFTDTNAPFLTKFYQLILLP